MYLSVTDKEWVISFCVELITTRVGIIADMPRSMRTMANSGWEPRWALKNDQTMMNYG